SARSSTLFPYTTLFRSIQSQSNEILAISCQRFGCFKFVALAWPVAARQRPARDHFTVQIAHGIKEPFGIAHLIAQSIKCYFFSGEIYLVEFIPDIFPVFL